MKMIQSAQGIPDRERENDSLTLEDVIDTQALQGMMDSFYRLTGIGIGIIDLQGRVLAHTGWQDICTRFHRVHPETFKNCIESCTLLSSGVEPGTFKRYRCKNNMWDMATPVMAAGKHLGNIFLAQYFYEDEPPDYDLFRKQARIYGFDEAEYMAALDRAPRWSRKKVDAAMTFYSKLAEMIAAHGLSTIRLSRAMSEKDTALEELRKFKTIADRANYGAAIASPDGTIIYLNAACARMHGWTVEELLGRNLSVFHNQEQMGRVSELHDSALREGEYAAREVRHVRRDGTVFPALMNAFAINAASGEPEFYFATVMDVTERHQEQMERKMIFDLLQILEQIEGLEELMEAVTGLLRDWSGCEAVGIRLQDKEDFPYFVTQGFPPEFVQMERSLCAVDQGGELLRDSAGNPVLECMCGNVILGRFDPGLPFFTEKGSFWTNSTTDLLASTTEEDRQARTRNRCHGEGYESVALIPLRHGGRNLGLIQINDSRRNMFDRDKMAGFERLASHLSIGLAERYAADALRKSEDRYRLLFEKAPLGYQSLDENGCFIEVNQAWLDTLGYSREEVIGKSFGDFLHPAWKDHFKENFPRFKAVGEILGIEFEMVRKDGSNILVSFNGRIGKDKKGRFQQTHCILRDITKQHQAEEALREERDRMQRYLDTTNSIIVALDQFGNVTMLNRYGLELLGYEEDRIIGKNWFDVALPQPEGREQVYPVFLEVIKGNIAQAGYFENDVLSASGKRLTIGWRNTYLCDKEGRTVGALSTGLDITEQKRAEEQVRQLQKAESLGRMAGAIAHHFNNKLSVVMGNLELALEDLSENDPVRRHLTQAMAGVVRSSEVSRMMLTYLGQMTGLQEPLDLAETFRRTLPMLKAGTPGHVLLTTDLPTPGPLVEANVGEMQQVLTNLLANAWESIGENEGVVHLALRTVAGRNIPESHRFPVNWEPRDQEYACLEVRDSGCGIMEENIKKLFDPFYSTKFTGRGLGLPIALGIVRAHRGVITVESTVRQQVTGFEEQGAENSGPEGSGSVFRVFLPLAASER